MNALNWFEIPVTDIHRACEFYAHLTGKALEVMEGNCTMAMLPCAPDEGIGGALVLDERRQPSLDGTLVYLAAQHMEGGLDGALSRAAAGGGEVIVPRTDIGEHGLFGIIKDSEGNAVGLHVER